MVRFDILESGACEVPQSRKRAFVWAASPEETLLDWPEPMHVFATKSTIRGAPLRSSLTLRDLPLVGNGASLLSIDHNSDPVSWFQKKVRGSTRCQRAPKHRGADWHSLPNEMVKLSNGQMEDLIPRWMITAKRNNQWKGLLGRLDWQGNFPTVITDPQPLGKVGTWFHREQDRVLTGFPDSYKFSGNIQDKHRQIGNAVPPPLAYALGRKLKESVEKKQSSI